MQQIIYRLRSPVKFWQRGWNIQFHGRIWQTGYDVCICNGNASKPLVRSILELCPRMSVCGRGWMSALSDLSVVSCCFFYFRKFDSFSFSEVLIAANDAAVVNLKESKQHHTDVTFQETDTMFAVRNDNLMLLICTTCWNQFEGKN